MNNANDLDADRRMALAKISGLGGRLAYGPLRDTPLEEAVAQLHAITRDPVVYGVALGGAICNVQLDGWSYAAALVTLFRAAGADEQVAARTFEWHRGRPAYRGSV